MTRPLMRHSIVDLESMPASPELLAELEHRTVPRARALLVKLRSATAPAPKTAAIPVAEPKAARRKPGRVIVPPKPVASVRASKPASRKRSKFCSPDPLAGVIPSWRSVSDRDRDYEEWYAAKFGKPFDPITQTGCYGYVERDAATGKIRQAVGDYGNRVWDLENAQPAPLPLAA
jgi:hypothetical protein